jgi:hypothetical protein
MAGWGASDWTTAALLAWQAYQANQDKDPKVTEAPMAPHQIYAANQLMDWTKPGGNPYMNYLGPIAHGIMSSTQGMQWTQPKTLEVPGIPGTGGQAPFAGIGPANIDWSTLMQPWMAQTGTGVRPGANGAGAPPNYGQGGRPTPNQPGQGPNIGATPLGDPRNYGMDLPTGIRGPRNQYGGSAQDFYDSVGASGYDQITNGNGGPRNPFGGVHESWMDPTRPEDVNPQYNPGDRPIPSGGQNLGDIYDQIGQANTTPEIRNTAMSIFQNQGFQNALAAGGWAAAYAWATAQFGPAGTLGIKLIQTIVRGVRGGGSPQQGGGKP